MQLSRIIAFPFAVIAGILIYLSASGKMPRAEYWLVLPILFLVLIFIMHHKIDEYGFQKFGIKLDKGALRWLARFDPFYGEITDSERKFFQTELALWLRRREFIFKSDESLPEEAKLMVGSAHLHLGHLTQSRDPWDLHERIVFYPHPFLSPQIDQIHISEYFQRDEVFIYALDTLLKAQMSPTHYLHPAYYEAAHALVIKHPNASWPEGAQRAQNAVLNLLGFNPDKVNQWLGKPCSTPALCIYAYIFKKSGLRKQLPNWFSATESFLASV